MLNGVEERATILYLARKSCLRLTMKCFWQLNCLCVITMSSFFLVEFSVLSINREHSTIIISFIVIKCNPGAKTRKWKFKLLRPFVQVLVDTS